MSTTNLENKSEAALAPRTDLERLLALEHPDPHSILGAHPSGDRVIVRAFRPGASKIFLLMDGSVRSEMIQRGASGIFEAAVTGRRDVFPYRLEVHYPDGNVVTGRDPYSFLPTLGDLDMYLWGEQKHHRAWEKLGAHAIEWGGIAGVAFAVWAPTARSVSVVGDFNGWDGRVHMMRVLGGSGIWELFVPGIEPGAIYKFEIRTGDGSLLLKSDPFATRMEAPPETASIVYQSNYQFGDAEWLKSRAAGELSKLPVSIYEVHLGSWRRVPEQGNRWLSYRELALELGDYVQEMGFTHVELMPVMEHPFTGSWGYQVSGYFAATARFGTPDDLRYLIDAMHRRGIGVILDWVPAHFPKDEFSLGRFDGTALYEHEDPRLGNHPDWGTYIFNYGRNEVRSFLIASALYWLGEFHADGLRVDAVASMIYLDYGRSDGDWIPNVYGGRENLDAIAFLRALNEQAYALNPGIVMIAEESTAWGGVSRPTFVGGLGFGFKWDMGWMHDMLAYMSLDPIHRKFHHSALTFRAMYAFSENFVLPLSHDEVVHGKSSLLGKMPGDEWRKFANLRLLYAWMYAQPGKKLLFMGAEIAQGREWNHDQSLEWHLLDFAPHQGVRKWLDDLNRTLRSEPALHELDCDPAGFEWIDCNNTEESTVAILRKGISPDAKIVAVFNFTPVPRQNYRIGVPDGGYWREILNSDSRIYGGSGWGNLGGVEAAPVPAHGRRFSVHLNLPPLGALFLKPAATR